MPGIEGAERDTTQDWIVPRGTVPLVSDLEARIDEALVTARASEEGVREVGEMALDAARQARRAAEAAEASARAAVEAVQSPAPEARSESDSEELRPAGPVSDFGLSLPGESSESPPPAGGAGQIGSPFEAAEEDAAPSVEEEPPSPAPPPFEARFRRFSERAERVSARLRELERVPV